MSAVLSKEKAAPVRSAAPLDMKLEVVVVPVSDVDRAKQFYLNLGWRLDADFAGGDWRIVQMTPTGSAASFFFGKGLTKAAPGSTPGRRSTTCCPRRSPSCARPAGACSRCGTSTCS